MVERRSLARQRVVTPGDAEQIAAIFAPIVRDTAISFEEEPPTVADMRERIVRTLERFPWLVAEDDDGAVLGYAYATQHRTRSAYRWSVEVAAYVRDDARQRGIASELYASLVRVLAAQGFHSAFAGVGLPNDASIGLHRKLGFEAIGVYREVGYKLGRWYDTAWFRLGLGVSAEPPEEPIAFGSLAPALVHELLLVR